MSDRSHEEDPGHGGGGLATISASMSAGRERPRSAARTNTAIAATTSAYPATDGRFGSQGSVSGRPKSGGSRVPARPPTKASLPRARGNQPNPARRSAVDAASTPETATATYAARHPAEPLPNDRGPTPTARATGCTSANRARANRRKLPSAHTSGKPSACTGSRVSPERGTRSPENWEQGCSAQPDLGL